MEASAPSRPGSLPPSLQSAPLSMPASAPGSVPPIGVRPPADDSRESELAPGTLVNSRYRVSALVGRGGMGDVYKADDLTLGVTVALKFLPTDALRDPNAVKLFINEVKIARRVSHANVCRVHDVGQFGDRWFISMEFVDGEDLGSLLRRIGRFPHDRGIELANQLCSGLAAAHDQGVLHRDLKPGNVLITASGEAKIADFGLAGLVEDLRADRSRAGTPAYMSPEQLHGEPPTVASDVYGLGLVLFEIFSGHPVFRPKDMTELLELHEKPIEPPSMFAKGIEPAVEQTIMSCLARQPAQRPPTALHVAASLPGGNLLSAAMHAGVTPSPSLVAAAGAEGTLRWSRVATGIAALVAALIVTVVLAFRTDLHAYVPLAKSADVLAEDARRALRSIGIAPTPHQAYAFDYYEELLDEMALKDRSVDRWKQLRRERPSPIDFWYRQHTRPLITVSEDQRVTMRDPAPVEYGMTSVRLDPAGRLRELVLVTESMESLAKEHPDLAGIRLSDRAPNPAPLFVAAGLDLAAFTPADPQRIPPIYADTRLAWTGVYPESPDIPIRVEIAFRAGVPVAFRIVESKLAAASLYKPIVASYYQELFAAIAEVTLIIASTIGAIVLALQNLRNRRGDRDGAVRLAIVAWMLAFAAFLLLADHVVDFRAEVRVVARAVAHAVLVGATTWLFYLAMEPLVRKHWPESLIAWARLLQGHWRDPLVGQSALAGVLSGAIASLLYRVHFLSPRWVGLPPDAPIASADHVSDTLEGGRLAYGVIAQCAVDGMRFALFFVMSLVLLRVLIKSRRATVYAFILLQAALWTITIYASPLSVIFAALMAVLSTLVITRLGMLAFATAAFTFTALHAFPLTLDLHAFYAPSTLLILSLVVGLASLGGAIAAGAFKRTNPQWG